MQLGEDTLQDAIQRIELHKRLTKDMAAIINGDKPTRADLEAAPLLQNYRFVPRSVPSAIGFGTGHPSLPNGPTQTSQIFIIGPDHRWIRTLSRFYRLGTPRPNSSSRDLPEDGE